ncbi:MAG: TolC family protein [Planctomycetaceae bacterium]|nr:TolC family protein [Planctomycetaceae bacterium]
MSSLAEVFVVLAALYAYECCAWVPRSALTLRAWASALLRARPSDVVGSPVAGGVALQPLPWFGKSAARVAAAQAELELRQAELESARSNARRELRDQWDRQSQATAEWHRRERELEPKARELAERASEAARSGQLPWTEAHAAREAAQEAMLALIESRRRARSASVDLRGALVRR